MLQPKCLPTVRKIIGKDILPKSLILSFHIVRIEVEVYCLVQWFSFENQQSIGIY